MSKLLIRERPLLVLPFLATKIGLNEAIFLQQLHFWLTPGPEWKPHYREWEGKMRPWVYNTYEIKHNPETQAATGWKANFPFWSVRTIKRAVSSLRETGLVITTDTFNSLPMDHTLWFTIDYQRLESLDDEITKLAREIMANDLWVD